MTNIQRVGMINSNNTQRNSDHDFTKLRKRALGNQGGVESKEQFIFDNDTKKLSAGSDIATAYILCTRPASNPIPNQKFLAQFEFTGSLDFLNITNGDKIFIEIKENLVKDPTLIEDLDSQTSYNQGLGIGEIKMAKNYPSHSNFLKLYEWNEGQLIDLRKAISIPAVDEVAQRTSTLEEKMSTAEGKINSTNPILRDIHAPREIDTEDGAFNVEFMRNGGKIRGTRTSEIRGANGENYLLSSQHLITKAERINKVSLYSTTGWSGDILISIKSNLGGFFFRGVFPVQSVFVEPDLYRADIVWDGGLFVGYGLFTVELSNPYPATIPNGTQLYLDQGGSKVYIESEDFYFPKYILKKNSFSGGVFGFLSKDDTGSGLVLQGAVNVAPNNDFRTIDGFGFVEKIEHGNNYRISGLSNRFSGRLPIKEGNIKNFDPKLNIKKTIRMATLGIRGYHEATTLLGVPDILISSNIDITEFYQKVFLVSGSDNTQQKIEQINAALQQDYTICKCLSKLKVRTKNGNELIVDANHYVGQGCQVLGTLTASDYIYIEAYRLKPEFLSQLT